MQRDFALAVTPIFNTALRWLEKITDKGRPTLRIEEIKDGHAAIKNKINAARKKLEPSNRRVWELIQYAIVAWIDEQCCSLSWEGRNWWQNNSLEVSYFGSKNAHDVFYEKAEEARQNRNAIEIYFLCVILGFRGIYMDLRHKDPNYRERAQDFVRRRGLPGDLREWLKRAAGMIPLGQSSSQLEVADREGSGALPLAAKTSFVSSLLFASIAVAALATYLYFVLRGG